MTVFQCQEKIIIGYNDVQSNRMVSAAGMEVPTRIPATSQNRWISGLCPRPGRRRGSRRRWRGGRPPRPAACGGGPWRERPSKIYESDYKSRVVEVMTLSGSSGTRDN